FRDEHVGACGSVRYDCAVDCFVARRSAPRDVSVNTVRGADTPNVWPIAGKLFREIDAEQTMGQRGLHRVFKVTNVFALNFPTIAKIDPRLGILISKQRRLSEIPVAVVAIPVALPRVP